MTASAELRDVTDQSFASEVLASETPALVDFWGDHCPACRQISPILKQLAADYAGRLRIVKMHAAENPATSARFGCVRCRRCWPSRADAWSASWSARARRWRSWS